MSTQQGRVSIREYARMRGVSDAAVRKWIAAGRMPRHPDGIDPVEADAAVAAHQSGSQPIRIAAPEAIQSLPLTPADPTRADYERDLASTKSERAKLALQRELEAVVPRAEVDKAAAEFVTTVKARLLLIPDVIADQVAALKEPIACRNVMEHEIRLALEELSRFQVTVAA